MHFSLKIESVAVTWMQKTDLMIEIIKKMGKANCFNPRLSVLSDLESSEKDEDRIPAIGSQDEKKKEKRN